MPIITQCPHCEKKLRAPDEQKGKQAKCPQCKKPFTIQPVAEASAGVGGAQAAARAGGQVATQQRPQAARQSHPTSQARPQPQAVAPSQPQFPDQWFLQTAEGQEYGPVTKAELDQWLTEDRIDAECQILQEGWEQWKWAEDVYPNLAAGGATEDNPFAAIADSASRVGASSGSFAVGGDANPYAAPQSSSGVAQDTGSEGVVTTKIVRAMQGTKPWVMFFAVLNFIGAGMYGLIALISLAGIGQSAAGALISFVFLGAYAGIFGFIGFLLLTYAKAAGAFVRTRSLPQLEKALDAQKNFWKTVGILAIVGLVLSVLAVILWIVILGAVVGMAAAAAGG